MSAVSKTVMPASSAACDDAARLPPRSSANAEIVAAEPERRDTRSPSCRAGAQACGACGSPSNAFRVAAEDQIARRRLDRRRAHAGDAIEVAHVERIIAAEQHAVGAGFSIRNSSADSGMHDGIVVEPADRRGRTVRAGSPWLPDARHRRAGSGRPGRARSRRRAPGRFSASDSAPSTPPNTRQAAAIVVSNGSPTKFFM